MQGDRCARHSAIVEVASDTDKNIEQRQASGGRMFPARTGGNKGRPIQNAPPRMLKTRVGFLIFQRTISD